MLLKSYKNKNGKRKYNLIKKMSEIFKLSKGEKMLYNIQVIMSTYNGEKYIKEQIVSIFNQQECNVSLLIRDDGSTDKTIEIIEELSLKYNIKLIQGENLGAAKSFLEAIKFTDEKNDFFAFSDQDDVWLDDKLISAIKCIERYNDRILLYASNLTAVNENLKIIQNRILPSEISVDYRDLLVKSPYLFGCTMVFNKNTRNLISNQSSQTPMMHDIWVALIACLNGKIIYDNNSYIYYRQHENNQVGAKIYFKDKLKSRWLQLKGKDRKIVSNQAKNIYNIIKNDKTISKEIIEYTKLVAFYDESLINKLKYLLKVSKKNMNIKQFIFHILIVLKGNF